MTGTSEAESILQEQQVGKKLAEKLVELLRDPAGRVRAEDFISMAATIVGERCMELAGDYDIRNHSMTPGDRVFSDRVNFLLTGNTGSDQWSSFPLESICGILRAVLLTHGGYSEEHFFSMEELFKEYAARIGDPADWGRVPLSLPPEHAPSMLPLQAGYETRAIADEFFAELGNAPARNLRSAVFCLASALIWTADTLDRHLGLRLALETVNGMAKTATMTVAAFERLKAQSGGKIS